MTQPSVIQPALLSKINERQVLRAIQSRGPMSRAEVARHSGISAPTASKAVESLLRAGLLEEADSAEGTRGRPAKKLRLASSTAQVLGLVFDADHCRIAPAGLDGRLHEDRSVQFATPGSYQELIEVAAAQAERLLDRHGVATLGMGICLPGLIDYREQRGVLSPNLPITDGRSPGLDLQARLELPCVLVQESHALCLAERYYGDARGMDDFAMLDVGTGVGLGVMSGGRLLTGHSGLAGEVGHITVDADGRRCGCGNNGCLETVACDAALAYAVSQRLGRKVGIPEAIELIRAGNPVLTEELQRACRYLAVGLAAVINLFNPSHLFVHGELFSAAPGLFESVIAEAQRRALPPTFAECKIVQARGSKRQGAVAAIIEHLADSVLPALAMEPRAHSFGTVALGR
ncbi:MAG: nagC [Armatimonadetes bacterium]|nr:nagC [Armatimonadota bacterium]